MNPTDHNGPADHEGPAEPGGPEHHGTGGHGPDDDPRWLDDDRNVKKIVYVLATLCALAFLADLFYTKHPFFGVEEFPAFYAIYGFVVSTALVLSAKELRKVVGRPEDYYERRHDAE